MLSSNSFHRTIRLISHCSKRILEEQSGWAAPDIGPWVLVAATFIQAFQAPSIYPFFYPHWGWPGMVSMLCFLFLSSTQQAALGATEAFGPPFWCCWIWHVQGVCETRYSPQGIMQNAALKPITMPVVRMVWLFDASTMRCRAIFFYWNGVACCQLGLSIIQWSPKRRLYQQFISNVYSLLYPRIVSQTCVVVSSLFDWNGIPVVGPWSAIRGVVSSMF